MLAEHLGYVADQTRLERFQAAIARVLRPGDVVADLGCGSGVLGLLCLRAGAQRVFAIDSTAMLHVARATLTRAGFADQVVFIRDYSQRVELPERVDVVICDHVGFFGFDYDIVRTVQDARRRFLKPGGAVIPARIRLQLAVVESTACRDRAEGWRGATVPPEFHWLRTHGVNAKYDAELGREAILGAPADLATIDLRADAPDYYSWSAELRVERDGVMHGLAGWFDCELADGVWMTNSPLAERPIQREQAFLPIDEAIPLRAGDLVKARIMARPTENQLAWIVELPASGQRFRHSTWQGMVLTPEHLVRANPGRVPQLSHEGRARSTVLGYCDGRRSVQQIEEAVGREHPDLFPSSAEIARFVAQVLSRDTE